MRIFFFEIWKSINCENECPCVYLCFTPLASLEASFCTPAAKLLAPHRNPNSAATSRLFVWLCHYWIETRRLSGLEVRMDTDSLWRAHLFNLWPSWTMFRLRMSSKHLTQVLDDPLVGEIGVAELPRVKPSFAFFLGLSADSQIHLMGRAWINLEKDRATLALKTLKCAKINNHAPTAATECHSRSFKAIGSV